MTICCCWVTVSGWGNIANRCNTKQEKIKIEAIKGIVAKSSFVGIIRPISLEIAYKAIVVNGFS